MNGQQNPAILDAPFVALGFVFRDSHTDQSAREATDCAANAGSREGCHDRSGSNERPEAGYCQCADAYQPAQTTAQQSTGACTSRRAFRGLGVLFVCEVFRAGSLGEQYGNVAVPKVRCFQCVDCIVNACAVRVDTKYCCVLTCHGVSPFGAGWGYCDL